MIKTLLISTVMNLQILYPSADVCEQAKTEILKTDPNVVCIPAGQSLSPADQMFDPNYRNWMRNRTNNG
jgi:acyl-homoserine lactone acylase PvdQ